MAYPIDIFKNESPGTVPAYAHGRGFGFVGISPVHTDIVRLRCVTPSRVKKLLVLYTGSCVGGQRDGFNRNFT